MAVVGVAALEYGVVPFIARAHAEASVLDEVSWSALIAATVLEIVSLAAYTRLTQVLSAAPNRLRFGVQWRIDLAGYGFSHAVPGGGAAGVAVRVRLMGAKGVPVTATLTLSALEGAFAVVGLLVAWSIGVLMCVPRTGVTGTVIGLTLVTVLVVAAFELGPEQLGRLRRSTKPLERAARRLLPTRWLASVRASVTQGAEALRDHGLTRLALAWSAANWILDAGCLWFSLRAFDASIPLELVIAAYGLPNLLAMLPLTPGGIGIVEALMVPSMVAAGASAGSALAGVLTWRLLQYWLPMPVGALCWASLE